MENGELVERREVCGTANLSDAMKPIGHQYVRFD
jgi:hypothetical protein